MSRSPKTVPSRALPDVASEQVRRDHAQAIAELQKAPAASTQIINGVELANAAYTRVPHGLGRAPRMVTISPIFAGSAPTSGRIFEERGAAAGANRAKAIVLYATGYGSAITVDIEVK